MCAFSYLNTQPAATDTDLLSIEDNTFDYRIIPNYDIIENQMLADMEVLNTEYVWHRERNATDQNSSISMMLRKIWMKLPKTLKNPDGDF